MNQSSPILAFQFITVVYLTFVQEWTLEQRLPQFVTPRSSILHPNCSAGHLILVRRDIGAYMSHFGLDPRSFDILHHYFATIYPTPATTGRPRDLNSRSVLAATLL